MALPTDGHVIESTFAPRRLRRPTYPWLPRADRVASITGLNGLIADHQRPLDDKPAWDWVSFDADWSQVGPSDEYVTGPLVRAGSQVRYVLSLIRNDPIVTDLSGWRLYFTPTEPTSLGDLLDVFEVYPIIRTAAKGVAVPSWRSGEGYFRRTSPADRVRNFPGYYTLRWTDTLTDMQEFSVRVIIEQPPEPF